MRFYLYALNSNKFRHFLYFLFVVVVENILIIIITIIKYYKSRFTFWIRNIVHNGYYDKEMMNLISTAVCVCVFVIVWVGLRSHTIMYSNHVESLPDQRSADSTIQYYFLPWPLQFIHNSTFTLVHASFFITTYNFFIPPHTPYTVAILATCCLFAELLYTIALLQIFKKKREEIIECTEQIYAKCMFVCV